MDILNILLGILLFFIIILIHEFGHFTVAKLCKMKVNEFAIGMGPKIFSKRIGETDYALRALPIGGSVSLDEDVENSDPNSFRNKPVWMRILVIAAGAFMNFVLGFIFCVVAVLASNSIATTTVADFQEGSVSSQYLKPGDKIVEINGMSIFNTTDISFQLSNSESRLFGSEFYSYNFKVERNGETVELPDVQFASHAYAEFIAEYKKLAKDTDYEALPGVYYNIKDDSYSEAFMEIEKSDPQFAEGFKKLVATYNSSYTSEQNNLYLDFIVLGVKKDFGSVISAAATNFISDARLIWISFINLLSGTYGLNEMSGPIGVVQSVSVVASFGWSSLLTLAALIAINVGIVNLLPIPAMDGGRLVFLVVEAIRGKPIKAEHEGMVHFIGIIALMLLMLVVTFNDIVRLFTGG